MDLLYGNAREGSLAVSFSFTWCFAERFLFKHQCSILMYWRASQRNNNALAGPYTDYGTEFAEM